jgi:hypothetical protein
MKCKECIKFSEYNSVGFYERVKIIDEILKDANEGG